MCILTFQKDTLFFFSPPNHFLVGLVCGKQKKTEKNVRFFCWEYGFYVLLCISRLKNSTS